MSETFRKRLQLRWLTLAEIVGVLALVIAGLGYWDSHRQHALDEREHQAAARVEAMKQTFLMIGAVESEGQRLRLTSNNSGQVIQTQTVWFPTAIRHASIETTGNPRLEAGWIEEGLRKTAGKARHGRLPVGVQTTFIEDGQARTDRALYWVGYSLKPRLLRPDRVELEGLSLLRRNVAGDLQAAADSLSAHP